MKVFKLFILVGVLAPFIALGQVSSKVVDPLNKPDVWKKLEANPMHEALWIAYFGKDLFDFSDQEYNQFMQWKQQLIAQRKLGPEKTGGTQQKAKVEYYEKIYGKIRDPYYQNLISNIHSNFLMIEEYFQEQFDFYGQVYVPYTEKHPRENFDKEQWIAEQEKTLTQLRNQQ